MRPRSRQALRESVALEEKVKATEDHEMEARAEAAEALEAIEEKLRASNVRPEELSLRP